MARTTVPSGAAISIPLRTSGPPCRPVGCPKREATSPVSGHSSPPRNGASGTVTAPRAPNVRLFEFSDANLGTYSPTRFVKAATAGEMVDRIRENRSHLDQVAVVSDDVPPTVAKARNVVMTVERDGVRVRAASDGPAHIPHCLVVVNGAPARLTRANLMQTLVSFEGTLDARLEFHFGLFADNKCRLRDGQDNKALGF